MKILFLENPQVERQSTQLQVQNAADLRQLQELEETMLRLLSSSTSNILDDSALTETLKEASATAAAVAARVTEAALVLQQLSSSNLIFKPLAFRGSFLFFVVKELESLSSPAPAAAAGAAEAAAAEAAAAAGTTEAAAEAAEAAAAAAAAESKDRIQTLIQETTHAVYTQTLMGLFEKHKLPFAFAVAAEIIKRELHPETAEAAALLVSGCGLNAEAGRGEGLGEGLGWNGSYYFSVSDLKASLELLRCMYTAAAAPQTSLFNSLKKLLSEITYGGRITNPQDEKTLRTLAQQFITEDLAERGFEEDEETCIARLSLEIKDTNAFLGFCPAAALLLKRDKGNELLSHLQAMQPTDAAAAAAAAAEQLVLQRAQQLQQQLLGCLSLVRGPQTIDLQSAVVAAKEAAEDAAAARAAARAAAAEADAAAAPPSPIAAADAAKSDSREKDRFKQIQDSLSVFFAQERSSGPEEKQQKDKNAF
ncbi:hypothetical protein, conserved [Eimeria tenella]|uniref:Uncharacterized protein n=1 Tax=Eimeria tenella TaxID=5802 RepID=U6KP05_EIMTE|nr:hypothetical protein, conserved [Eimeria tenella]CDJ38551.1 hypothetical protein, conserved [Eimeria tenella]|eukprot:XP_013229389.1 hypothetical protein, conserved [Eimeria tenella]